MRYGQIRKLDASNGPGIRTSFFVTGCTRNCIDCFNTEYQDFNFGKEWTSKETEEIIENLKKDNIKGLSILGGEPFENSEELINIIKEIKKESNKDIWVWSGFLFEKLIENKESLNLLKEIDVLVDGPFINSKKDLRLKFRGSSNQRIIDVKKSLTNKEVVLLDKYM